MTGKLEHNAIIIEKAIHPHIFLIDYREDTSSVNGYIIEITIFQTDCADYGIYSIVVGNDSIRTADRIIQEDIINRYKGLLLRNNLKLSLMAHDTHRPRNEDN